MDLPKKTVPGETLLKIEHLKKHFGNQLVLDDVNLEVKKGEIVCIIGQSGGGKSVILKHIIGLIIPDGGRVKSGERVETVITIEGKNNYEYLLFEDLKPAGFEAVEIRSGESLYARELKSGAVERKFANPRSAPSGSQPATAAARRAALRPTPKPKTPPTADENDLTGRSRWVYQELRDRKVALFIDKLPEGVWEIRYDMRAEVPGVFHALPVLGQAMYVPEIRCNGAELRVKVEDSKP